MAKKNRNSKALSFDQMFDQLRNNLQQIQSEDLTMEKLLNVVEESSALYKEAKTRLRHLEKEINLSIEEE